MSNPVIEEDGTKRWFDEDGNHHRADGPAVEYASGIKMWSWHGKIHRVDGQAIEMVDGSGEWYLADTKLTEEEFKSLVGTLPVAEVKSEANFILDEDGSKTWLDAEGKPYKVEYANGDKEWYKGGELHREDGPAIEKASGHKEWLQHDKLHRLDGPAIVHADGRDSWFQNGERHRVDGPAQITADGEECWCINGELHRLDGPAVIAANGAKYWYVIGVKLTEAEFDMYMSPLKESVQC